MTLHPTPNTMVSINMLRYLFFFGSACPGPYDPAPYTSYPYMGDTGGRLVSRYMPKWMGSGGSCRNGNCSAYVSAISDTVYTHTHTNTHTHTHTHTCICICIYRSLPKPRRASRNARRDNSIRTNLLNGGTTCTRQTRIILMGNGFRQL
jgi:hypothetical protein